MLSSPLRSRRAGGYDTRGAMIYSKNGKKLSRMDLESISCPCCKMVLKQPVQLITCGDRFCRTCLENVSTCPVDGEVIDPKQVRDDKGCQKELLSLKSSCTLVMKGCPWEGPLVEIEDHMQVCEFATVTCSSCSKEVPKQKIAIHESEECPNIEVKCAFQECDAVMLLSQLQNHYSQHLHKMALILKTTLTKVDDLTAENARLRKSQEKLEEKLLSLKLPGSYLTQTARDSPTVNIPSLSSFLPCRMATDSDDEVLSEVKNESFRNYPSLPHSDRGYKSSLASTSSSGYGSLPAPLAEPYSYPVVDESVCQIQKRLDYIQPMLEELREEVRKQGSQLAGCIEMVQTVKETVDRHAVKMEDVKVRQDVLDVKTTTGVFIWKIPDVRKRHKDAVDHRTLSLYSPPFQTSPHGYRMCIRAYLNGDGSGKGTHISVFLVIMRSEQDNLLQWPFLRPVTFTLVNQAFPLKSISETFLPNAKSPSFQQPRSDMNIASGFPCFASQSVLKDDYFAKGNAIFIRCQIDTQGLTCD